jgi:hypothetical protein
VRAPLSSVSRGLSGGRLHALELEELSGGMAWTIQKAEKGFHYNP